MLDRLPHRKCWRGRLVVPRQTLWRDSIDSQQVATNIVCSLCGHGLERTGVKPLCKSRRGQSKVTLQATVHPPDPKRIRGKPRLGWIPSAVPPYWPWHIALAYPISSWHVYEAHCSWLCWPAVHMILAVVVLLLAAPKSWACQLPRHHGRCNGSCHTFDPPWTRMLHGTHSWHGSNHSPRPLKRCGQKG